jgi:hypothetical protein
MKKSFFFLALVFLLLILSCGGGGGNSSSGGSSTNTLNGSWSGTWQSSKYGNLGAITATFNQSGSSFTGTAVITNSPCFSGGTISGSISGNNISFSAPYGNFSGNFTDSSMSGTYNVTSGACTGDTGTFKLQK